MQSSSPQPSTWAVTSFSSGLQDARSSICEPSPCRASSPKPVEMILVAVPLAAVYLACRGIEGVDQPRPGDVGEERVEADVGLQRCLREADDPERAAPGLRLVRVVQEDEPSCAEVGVGSVPRRPHIGGESDGVRRELAGCGDLRDHEFRPGFRRSDALQRRGELRGSAGGRGCCRHVRTLESLGGRAGEARRLGRAHGPPQGRGYAGGHGEVEDPENTDDDRRRGRCAGPRHGCDGRLRHGARRAARHHSGAPPAAEPDASVPSTGMRARHASGRPPDSTVPGRYGLWFADDTGYATVGGVIERERRFGHAHTREGRLRRPATRARRASAGTTTSAGGARAPGHQCVDRDRARAGAGLGLPAGCGRATPAAG